MFRTLTDELRRLRLTILSLAAATLVSCGGGDSVAPRPIRFASPVELELAQNSIAMAIGDVTGDGIADVVMTASTPPGIDGPYGLYLFAGRVDGSLAPALLVTGGAIRTCYPSSIAVGDIDGDGRNDVVVGASQCGPQVFPSPRPDNSSQDPLSKVQDSRLCGSSTSTVMVATTSLAWGQATRAWRCFGKTRTGRSF